MSTLPMDRQVKAKAIEYYRGNNVLSLIETILNKMFMDHPGDTSGYLCQFFKQQAISPRVINIGQRKVINTNTGSLYRILIEGSWLEKCKILSRLIYEVPRKDDQRLTSMESDPETEVEVLLKEILQKARDKQLTHQSLKEMDAYIRQCYDKHTASIQKQRETVTPEAERAEVKHAGAPNKPSVSGNKLKNNPSTLSVTPSELTDLASPVAFHYSATSLALCLAACNSFRPPLQLHESMFRLVDQILESSCASREVNGKPKQTEQLPLPIMTALNGSVPGIPGVGVAGKCKCLRQILLIPKPTLRAADICDGMFKFKRQMDGILTTKPYPGLQMLCSNGAPAIALERPEQGLDLVLDVLEQLQLKEHFSLGLHLFNRPIFDQVKGKYEPVTGVLKSPEEMVGYYVDLVAKYPTVHLLIEPFRKEDTQCWTLLNERIGSRSHLATTNIPQPIVQTTSGPRKASMLPSASNPRVGLPSGPNIAEVAGWNCVNNLSCIPTQAVSNLEEDNSSVLREVTNETNSEMSMGFAEEDQPQLSFSSWLVSTEAVLDCCLMTELIKSIDYINTHHKITIFDAEHPKFMDVLPVDLAVGLSFCFVKLGGLGNAEQQNRLLHWLRIATAKSDPSISDNDQPPENFCNWITFNQQAIQQPNQ